MTRDDDPGDRKVALAGFQTPTVSESLGQIATSFGGFLAVCAGMYLAANLSAWAALALAPLAAGFLVRIFMIQHDCGHGSFFRSRRANEIVGLACSLFTLTPFAAWRRQHAGHHGIWNDLDRRYSGADIYSSCLTVTEYERLGAWQRRGYRLMRHPLVANVLLPPFVFLLLYRLPFDTPKTWRRERRAVHLTNIGLVVVAGGMGWLVGFGTVALVQLPVIVLGAIIGVWLFSVQHRFENTLWVRHDEWSYAEAAIRGSSYLRLPSVLRWFTANIGFHHVHHLNPRIPNYRLRACHAAHTPLQRASVLTLGSALRQWRYALWDEAQARMVPFGSATG